MPSKPSVLLISRLPVHGAFLRGLLSKYYNVVWIGETFPFKITLLNVIYVISVEFWKSLASFRKSRFAMVVVQFVSLDGIVGLILKRIFRTKLVLFAVGSDVLRIHQHAFAFPMLKSIIDESDCVFCVSTLIEKKLRELGVDASKIRNIPSVVSFDDFKPYSGLKEYDVVTVGAIDSNKNQLLLLKACELFPSIKALVIGDGPSRLALESESAEKKVNMVFLGKVSHEQVLRELQKSRIYVHTSKSEGLPVAVLEAMFAGLPVILMDSPYVHVLQRSSDLVFHVACRDSPQDLANKILKVSKNYEHELRSSLYNKRIVSKLVSETRSSTRRTLDAVMQNRCPNS